MVAAYENRGLTIRTPYGFGFGEETIFLVALVPVSSTLDWYYLQNHCQFSLLQSSVDGEQPFTTIFNPYNEVCKERGEKNLVQGEKICEQCCVRQQQVPRLAEAGDVAVVRHKVSNLTPGTQYRFKVEMSCEGEPATVSSPLSEAIATSQCGNGVVEIGEDCETGVCAAGSVQAIGEISCVYSSTSHSHTYVHT